MTRVPAFGPPQGDEDVDALVDILSRSFNAPATFWTEWIGSEPVDRLRVIRSGREVAGGLRMYHMGQWFGGRSVRMTGIAGVGVAPHMRAGGTASKLVRATLEELHGMGVPISVLFPATQPVYRRQGFERAGTWIRYVLPVDRIDVRDRALEMRPAGDADTHAIRTAYTIRARRTAGNLDRSEVMWSRALTARDEQVHGYVVKGEDGVEGYVFFSQKQQGAHYDLIVRDIVVLTPSAGRRILTFFADHRSLAGDMRWRGGPAEPFLYLLSEQGWQMSDPLDWMLRIVDVRGALVARGYPAAVEAELHLDVRDDILGWNEGRFCVEVSGGHAKVRKGGRGRLRVDVRGLAAMYTGYQSAAELVACGYADGTERDLATADAIFGGPAPWMPELF